MGEQGGLRTGWLAAFGTEGYDGEPPLLEELGVNFGHIKVKVRRAAEPPPQSQWARILLGPVRGMGFTVVLLPTLFRSVGLG